VTQPQRHGHHGYCQRRRGRWRRCGVVDQYSLGDRSGNTHTAVPGFWGLSGPAKPLALFTCGKSPRQCAFR
jgi:hypothetical protein